MQNNEKDTKNLKFDQAAIDLLNTLEKENREIKESLLEGYMGLPLSPKVKEEIYNYFITHSLFSVVTMANPGSSVITEFLYHGLPSSSPIDNYFIQSKAGKSIKARLIAIEKELPKIIEKYRQNHKNSNILIGNLGSGPGRDVINVFSNHYQNVSDVKAIHIDKDMVALEKGKRMAKIKGVNHLIEFIQGDFLKYNHEKKFDILLLSGILCALEIETCIICLEKLKKLLKKDGCLIASNVTKKMLKEDPFTCYLMARVGNWKLVFKDEEELKQIFRAAGYNWEGCFNDSYGFHIMGLGTAITS
jgi:SAM-dependent methyltransferase